KDKILAYVKEDINKSVHATVSFSDASISFFRSFPDMQISIDSMEITGLDEFDGITLYKAVNTSLDISLLSLFKKNITPKINSLDLDTPEINVIILDKTHANYLIMKDTTKSNYTLQLEKYTIENGKLTYQDNTMQLIMNMEGINHNGTGDFTQDIFDLETNTVIDTLNVVYMGTSYLSNATADIKAGININFPEKKYTLRNNDIKVNEFQITADGYVQMNGDNIFTDVSFKSASEQFKSILSIVPNAFTKDFKDIQTKGSASINGLVKGNYNSIKGEFPAFDIKINITDGFFKYPTLTQSVKDIFADIHIKATRSDYKDMFVNIPAFRLAFGNDPISGKLTASNLTGDQKVEGSLHGKINLQNVLQAFPMAGVNELSGVINCALDFKAKMSDVNNKNYGAIAFSGGATGHNIVYRGKGQPYIKIKTSEAIASPAVFVFTAKEMQLGKSDLSIHTEVVNPLALFSTEKNMDIKIKATSSFVDLNEWQTDGTKGVSNSNNSPAPMTIDENILKNTNITLNLNSKQTIFNQFSIQNINLDGKLAANAMQINDMSGVMDKNDFRLSGTVINAYDYMFNNGIVDGKLTFTSVNFDANKFMTSDGAKGPDEPRQVIPVPEKVRLSILADIKNLTYTNLHLEDFKVNMDVANQEVALRNMETKTLGGVLLMDGLYNTTNLLNPDFSVKLDMSKIKFVEAISKIEILKKLAPIAAYIDGYFNTTLVMKGKLGSQMIPDLKSLDASGFLETISGSLKGFNPIATLADKLGIP
ncbi:MAG: hypothetical protein H7X99_06005, partial [Saprospiraceae bacterium]|nr:hypothetical protein [Saprospiraceae bacterium]